MHDSAVTGCEFQMPHDSRLGPQIAALRIEHRHLIVVNRKDRKAAAHPAGIKHVERQAVQRTAFLGATDDPAVRSADLQDTGDRQNILAQPCFHRPPVFIGTQQQWYIGRVLEIAEPDQPAVTVGRPQCMRRMMGIKADRPDTARGKMCESGTSHGAETNDGNVELSNHRQVPSA